MISIAYIYGTEFTERRHGIFERATELGVRIFNVHSEYLDVNFMDTLEITRPDICIVESDYIGAHNLTPDDFEVPVVVCDLEKSQSDVGFTGIQYDRTTAAHKAMNALFSLDLPNYAFAGYHRPCEWSVRRESVFREMMESRGMTPLTYSFRRRKRLTEYFHGLQSWLLNLPRPCGIFAVNDEVGDYVTTLAGWMGISVPDSLAVVGIDNDVDRCENTHPPLASVPPDSVRSGRLAVDFALQLLTNPAKKPSPVSYGAGAVVARGSLRRFRQHDSAAARAMEFIRVHATDRKMGLNAVADAIGLPVCTARMRFKKYAGHSIFEEIENQRFLHACSLLRKRNNKIMHIHESCGYGCEKALRNVFVKRTGLTPSEWRARHS